MLALSSQCPSLSFSLPSSFCTLVYRVPISRFVRWLQSSDDVGRKLVVKVDTVSRGIGILSPAKKLKWCPCLMPKRCYLDSAVSFVYTINYSEIYIYIHNTYIYKYDMHIHTVILYIYVNANVRYFTDTNKHHTLCLLLAFVHRYIIYYIHD